MLRQSKNLALFGVLLLLISCGESVGPDPGPLPPDSVAPLLDRTGVTLLNHSDGFVPPTYAVCPTGGAAIQCVSPTGTGDWSFWAVQGHDAELRIPFSDVFVPDSGVPVPDGDFIKFKVRKNSLAYRADGSEIARGDSVLITVTVDPEVLSLQFAPGGLVFSDDHPAELTISYAGTDSDLNGDGANDWLDGFIRQALLGMWYQTDGSDEWEAITAQHKPDKELFKADLFHFSNYAVGW